jgi:hypothetical protein
MSKRRRAGDDDDGSGKEAAAHRAAAASSAQAAAAPGGAPQSEAAYLSGLTARTVARGAGFGALRDASAPASSGRIRLLSYNVNSLRKRATEPHFAAWLRAAAPDVLCLQEVKIRRAGELRSALLEGGCGGSGPPVLSSPCRRARPLWGPAPWVRCCSSWRSSATSSSWWAAASPPGAGLALLCAAHLMGAVVLLLVVPMGSRASTTSVVEVDLLLLLAVLGLSLELARCCPPRPPSRSCLPRSTRARRTRDAFCLVFCGTGTQSGVRRTSRASRTSCDAVLS